MSEKTEPIKHVAPNKPLPDFIVEHLRQYAEDPVKAHLWDASFVGGSTQQPILLLTTTGRKSQRPSTFPLVYAMDDDRYIVVASNGGAPRHPAWYLNLEASGFRAEMQVAEKKFRVQGKVVTGAEKERLWQKLCAAYAPLDSYKLRTEREIPLIVFTEAG